MKDRARNDQSMRQSERIRRALARRDLEALTPEAILKAFREEGIRSLEDYARKLSAVYREGRGAPQRIDVAAFARRTPARLAASIKHKVPEVPFVVGGVVHDPKDIARFNGRELLFVDGDELRVYTERDASALLFQSFALYDVIEAALKRAGGLPSSKPSTITPSTGGTVIVPPPPPSQGSPSGTPNLIMCDDADYGACDLYLESGYAFPDLTECYTPPFGSGWNDCISSIYPTQCLCVFSEHINFQGSQLVSSGNSNLTTIGWNDRISSVQNFRQVTTKT
jgi:hypothetical protein